MVNYVRGLVAAVVVVLATWACGPPLPAGAPKVQAETVCYENRTQPPPPFGDGSTFRVYFWQFWSDKGATFRHHDDAYGGTIDHPSVVANQRTWLKATIGWKLYWSHLPGSEALVFSVAGPADPNAVPLCTWVVPPI